MARVPAICDSCQTLCVAESIIKGNASNVTFANCKCGPCPNCGGDCSILDGAYEFIGNTIKLLSGPQYTIARLKQLAKILKDAQSRNANAQEIKNQVNRELPELSDILPKTQTNLYAFITMLLAVIALFVDKRPNIEINQVVNNINNITQNVQISTEKKRIPPQQDTKLANQIQGSKKIGRNDPCPCGSDKKYKRCHGKEKVAPPMSPRKGIENDKTN